MGETTDWRLQNQLSYFKGAELVWRVYRPTGPDWKHDHCEFCWAEFAERDEPTVLHSGYSTPDEYRWVCRNCFEDFRELFCWQVSQFAPP